MHALASFKHFVRRQDEKQNPASGERVSKDRTYLDHSATTPLRAAAKDAMMAAFDLVGNASSIHAEGRAARAALATARKDIADSLEADAKEIIFTSGATEALNTILRPSPHLKLASDIRLNRLLVLATDHKASIAGHDFAADRAAVIAVDGSGLIDLTALEQSLATQGPALVSAQWVNSETGVIQPVAEIAGICRAHGSVFVCDAVAAAGKIAVSLKQSGAHALVIAAHKFGGPKGAGVLALDGSLLIEQPLLKGGGQEMRRRSGTENVPAIMGLAAAFTEAAANVEIEHNRVVKLRDKLEAGLKAICPDAGIAGQAAPRVPHVTCVMMAGLPAETALIRFDLADVSVSSGSACSSGKVARSHVLDAMGIEAGLAECSIRFSLGWTSSEADIDRALAACTAIYGQTSKASGLAA
jgi:cysteine desulfurase